MTRIKVETGVPYEVVVDYGAANKAAMFIKTTLTKARKVVLVSDSNVAPLHAEKVLNELRGVNLETSLFTFEAGEKSKTLATYSSLINFLAEKRLARTDVLVALGGGVTGDLTGFAAATFMRGIDFIQIPTSLLAMVDSSVGGKTGVDLPSGKNLVGAFHQPRAVFCDVSYLDTLPDIWIKDGMGEVLKYAILGDKDLFSVLESYPKRKIGEVEISKCIGMKRDIVNIDEKEGGVRKLLNLGHTFGHAIEKLSDFGITHGHAISTGIAFAARSSRQLGLLSENDCERIVALVAAMGYDPTSLLFTGAMADAIMGDKKVSAGSIDFVLPIEIGKCVTQKTPLEKVEEMIDNGR